MNLSGRRESSNVDDRRGMSGGGFRIGGGIGAIVISAIIYLLSGGDLGSFIQQTDWSQVVEEQPATKSNYRPSADEQEWSVLCKKILAGTEDVWSEQFRKIGKEYEPATLVLYNDRVNSACGSATSSVGPFYCSGDQCLYVDLSFFRQMRDEMGAGGDFAYAYVIGHEVGHHIQYLLGTTAKVHQAMSRMDKASANELSVRLELQADYYAGVWAYHDNKDLNLQLTEQDIRDALNCASKIGDDYLQRQARGTVSPESFTHGTSAQRYKWLKKGLECGDIRQGDTFSCNYNDL